MPTTWLKPLATNLALYFSTSPWALSLTLKVHLEFSTFHTHGKGIKVYVLFFLMEFSLN